MYSAYSAPHARETHTGWQCAKSSHAVFVSGGPFAGAQSREPAAPRLGPCMYLFNVFVYPVMEKCEKTKGYQHKHISYLSLGLHRHTKLQLH